MYRFSLKLELDSHYSSESVLANFARMTSRQENSASASSRRFWIKVNAAEIAAHVEAFLIGMA
jgi:hypothetical protein